MSLLTDTVDLANIEAGTFRLLSSQVNLNEVVNDCVARVQPEANEARLIVRMSLSPAAPALDRERLHQALAAIARFLAV